MGSLFTLAVTLALSFPLGVAAAVYLEEFAARNRWTDLIEVNINNLAAVPSIVYGLLGLAVFINWLAVPRSSPLVGGLVLALMSMPTVIIATRSALKAVPPSIREAALGVGAARTHAVDLGKVRCHESFTGMAVHAIDRDLVGTGHCRLHGRFTTPR
jgi:phosphate transport system permease protein